MVTATFLERIERAVPAARVVRVEPDDLVTASEIARRIGRSRQAVAQLIARHDDFPAAAAMLGPRTAVYEWSAVAAWLARHELQGDADAGATAIAAVNDALALRRHVAQLGMSERKHLVDLVAA